MKKVPIRIHTANALKWLGSLYRNPAEAIKEHISNAVDEHLKAKMMGKALPVCEVTYQIEKNRIVIEYPYGMSKEEFIDALQRVADSVKKNIDFKQIGQLGIGMFSFLQIGRKCTFYSKKDEDSETIKVILREGSDSAEFENPRKRELLQSPGIRIVISELLFDPTKPRGPLSPARLQRVFAEKFDPFLKGGSLRIAVFSRGKPFYVKPLKIELPPIGKDIKDWSLSGKQNKRLSLELYFDPSGKGIVGIRHMGVTIVDDIKTLSAYGLEESVYAGGYVRGFIDADFLRPLPARTGFEENNDWIRFIDELDRIRPMIEAEVESLKQQEAEKKLTEVQKKAIKLAIEILNTDEFEDLQLLEGLGRRIPEPASLHIDFTFVPSSIRIKPGETGIVRLKASVPEVVPDGSIVELAISNPSIVKLIAKNFIIKSSDADENGIVTKRIQFKGKRYTAEPVILTAKTGELRAYARIRVAEPLKPREPITGKEGKGSGINYEEVEFEDGPFKHSRYIEESRTVQINTLNPDYKRVEESGSIEEKIAYGALMIGKETVAFNDKHKVSDDYLERLLSFYFRLKDRLTRTQAGSGKKQRKKSSKGF